VGYPVFPNSKGLQLIVRQKNGTTSSHTLGGLEDKSLKKERKLSAQDKARPREKWIPESEETGLQLIGALVFQKFNNAEGRKEDNARLQKSIETEGGRI